MHRCEPGPRRPCDTAQFGPSSVTLKPGELDRLALENTSQNKEQPQVLGSSKTWAPEAKRRKRPSNMQNARKHPLLTVISLSIQVICLLADWPISGRCSNVAPTIDYSHNMRILKLPKTTQVGSLIYRLKASDPDPSSQLVFGVSGIDGRGLLDVQPVARSWNEADVYLRSPLDQSQYNFTVFVTDGNMTTQVESTVLVTDSELGQTTTDSPFVNTRNLFRVPENAQPNDPIGTVTALESKKSDLPVKFELRGKGADKFSIRYVFGPHQGQSRAEIVLAQRVDFEKQNLFALKILALNAWTDTRFDTRNVATLDFVVTLADVQDTPPVFKNLPQSLRLANSLQPGDLVAQIEAEDGDYADQRQVSFALDASSPLAAYFDINRTSGELHLVKPISELLAHAAWSSEPGWSQLSILATEQPDSTSYDHLWPPMFARAEIPLLLIDQINEPPQFLGGWQTGTNVRTLHGFLFEPTDECLGSHTVSDCSHAPVRWYTNASSNVAPQMGSPSSLVEQLLRSFGNRPLVLDLGLGANGTFALSLEGQDAHLFQMEPSFPVSRQTTFNLWAAPEANRSVFDRDSSSDRRVQFSLEIVARDFGTAQRESSRIKCQIELLDVNDNAPQFENELFTFNVYENAPVGHIVGQVRARDVDSNSSPPRYTALTGKDSRLFRLDPSSGQITLESGLDRERTSMYLFIVEARDSLGFANYSQIMVNVLDVNDNAPAFLQSHYDAVLLADGTFYQPLVVRAFDADEPGSVNSQVAYEIIAGNQNDQFIIDSLSGVIYPSLSGAPLELDAEQGRPGGLPALPPALTEPIIPYQGHGSRNQNSPEPAGKIMPSHEVEDASARHATTSPHGSPRYQSGRQRMEEGRNLSAPPMDVEQLPALDLLLNLESSDSSTTLGSRSEESKHLLAARSYSLGEPSFQSLKVPPVTTLIVRAHDFGIPVRSSTVRVSIYNQALLSRSISVILNGTAEHLELKRESLERALSSLTGSRASVESIDALSDSSSISVARVKLAVPPHSLVDLTDLSGLLSALDYKPAQQVTEHQQFRHPELAQPGSTLGGLNGATHYIATGDKLVPVGSLNGSTNGNLFNEIQSYAIDTSGLERRLLIYIIIVAVCILILLLIWMVYSCSKESEQVKIIEAKSSGQQNGSYRSTVPGGEQDSGPVDVDRTTNPKTSDVSSTSPIINNLAKGQQRKSSGGSPSPNITLHRASNMTQLSTTIKPDHYSMYNGQVWFTPAGVASLGPGASANQRGRQLGASDRRASSAPSGGSLESALHSAIHSPGHLRELRQGYQRPAEPRAAKGEFFPNTIGYMENLEALQQAGLDYGNDIASRGRRSLEPPAQRSLLGRRHRRRKVVPAGMYRGPNSSAPSKPPRLSVATSGGQVNRAFEEDLERGEERAPRSSPSGRGRRLGSRQREASPSLRSDGHSGDSAASIELDSDQELLGFDSTGTPIIATHTRASANIQPLVVDAGRAGGQRRASQARPAPQKESSAGGEQTSAAKTEAPQVVPPDQSDRLEQPALSATPDQGELVADTATEKGRVASQEELMSELSDKLDSRRKASEPETSKAPPTGTSEADSRSISSSGSGGVAAGERPRQQEVKLEGMKNGELLERQSIFALTYSGLATDKLPS